MTGLMEQEIQSSFFSASNVYVYTPSVSLNTMKFCIGLLQLLTDRGKNNLHIFSKINVHLSYLVASLNVSVAQAASVCVLFVLCVCVCVRVCVCVCVCVCMCVLKLATLTSNNSISRSNSWYYSLNNS